MNEFWEDDMRSENLKNGGNLRTFVCEFVVKGNHDVITQSASWLMHDKTFLYITSTFHLSILLSVLLLKTKQN